MGSGGGFFSSILVPLEKTFLSLLAQAIGGGERANYSPEKGRKERGRLLKGQSRGIEDIRKGEESLLNVISQQNSSLLLFFGLLSGSY